MPDDIALKERAVDDTQGIVVRNPYCGHVVGTVPRMNKRDVEKVLRQAANHERNLSAAERAALLLRVADRLEEEREDFAQSIIAESGLCRKDALKEIGRGQILLKTCAEEVRRLTGETIPTNGVDGGVDRLAMTLRIPRGVICAVTPFNRPLNQVLVKLAPAIAANNAVVLKPSEKTPLTALKIVDLMRDCGLPDGMVQVVTGHPEEIGDTLITSPVIDMLTFTGSTQVGHALARKCGMIRTTFELGDSGALIVLADADLSAAAKAAATGAFATAGQSCRGVKRILVEESVADSFAKLLEQEARSLVVGDPADPETDIGTLISEDAARDVEARVVSAIAAGATLLCGGSRERAQIPPTVLDYVPPDTKLVAEETFGPCAPIIRVNDFAHAIDVANATPYGLQAGIYTANVHTARAAMDALDVGAVIINGGPQFDSPLIPFSGVKASGLGEEGARFAIREMTRTKVVVL